MPQPDVITLAVDTLNNGTTNDEDYSRFDTGSANRVVYIGENHSMTTKDTLTLYRTFPKVSGNFRGTAKTAVKFSQDKVVTGVDGVAQLTSPIIVEVSFSIPVGVTEADMLIARQKAIALLDLDTVMDELNGRQMV